MTEWFDREKGETGPITKVTGEGDVLTVALYGNVPDWVRTPPNLGSVKIKVLRGFRQVCPMCETRRVLHLRLDSPLGVAQCHDACGFVWYRIGGPDAD